MLAGVFYVLTGLTSVIGEMFIPGRLVVRGDATATANAIVAHKHLFGMGFSALLIAAARSIALTALFLIGLKAAAGKAENPSRRFRLDGLLPVDAHSRRPSAVRDHGPSCIAAPSAE